jgi:hypothetical protein
MGIFCNAYKYKPIIPNKPGYNEIFNKNEMIFNFVYAFSCFIIEYDKIGCDKHFS